MHELTKIIDEELFKIHFHNGEELEPLVNLDKAIEIIDIIISNRLEKPGYSEGVSQPGAVAEIEYAYGYRCDECGTNDPLIVKGTVNTLCCSSGKGVYNTPIKGIFSNGKIIKY